MASYQNYDHTAPEVVQQSIPEVYHPPPASAVSPSYYSPAQDTSVGSPYKAESATLHPGYTPSPINDTHSQATSHKAKKGVCGCGCTLVVLVLSIIVAALAAAVIGLAVGTGIQTNRANDANEKLSALSASGPATQTETVTVSASAPTETGYAAITRDCSDEDEKTTGTNYTTEFLNKVTFTMFCNSNAPPFEPLMALAVPDFDRCMDACASYTKYVSAFFDDAEDNVNATCTAVSFIPGWTARESAIKAKAEGNCYLKSGRQTRSGLEPVEPGIGETHAAIVSGS
ncbi:hypothetical protein ACHAQA_005427 [Verticillium albo-atrum]